MVLNTNEYEDLFIFYLQQGYDITTLDTDDENCSDPLFIAKTLFENNPLKVDTFYNLITEGCLRDFFNPTLHKPEKFYQGQQLLRGLTSKIDISHYWDSLKYTANQMAQIRLGLEHNINIVYYNNPLACSCQEMQIIRLALESIQSMSDDF